MSGKKKRLILLCVIALEIAVLSVLGFLIVKRDRNPVVFEHGNDFWYSVLVTDYYAGTDSVMHVSEDNINRDLLEMGLPAFQEYLADHFPASGYTLTISYSSTGDNHAAIDDGSGIFLSDDVVLRAGEDREVTYDFITYSAHDSFRILLYYDGEGEMTVTRVSLSTSSRLYRDLFTMLLTLFIVLDLLLVWSVRHVKLLKKNRGTILFLAGLIIACSAPLFTGELYYGHDIAYHLARIESVYVGLRTGQLPVRISPTFCSGAGDASSIFYCDIFLVFPAVLRMLGFPHIIAYKAYILLVNAATALIGWACFKQMFRDQRAALLTDLLWCMTAYRFSNLYIRASLGEFTAMVFEPMVLLAFYRIYRGSDKHTILQNAALMAAGMSGILMSHILSTEIVCMMLLAAVLILWRQTFTKKVLRTWLLAVLIAAGLSAWFIVPFLEYYLTVPVKVNTAGAVFKLSSVPTVGSLLSGFFQNMYITPGYVLLAAAAVWLILLLRRKTGRRENLPALGGIGSLILSTDLIPWASVIGLPVVGVLFRSMEFPWRFMMIACMLLPVLSGFLLIRFAKEKPRLVRIIAAAASVIVLAAWGFYSVRFVRNTNPIQVNYFDNTLSDLGVYDGEYNRAASGDAVTADTAASAAETEIISQSGCSVTVYAKAGDEAASVTFPTQNYPHYHVTDEAGNEYEIHDSADCMVSVTVPAGFDGELRLYFEEPVRWRLAELISLLSAVLLPLLTVRERKARKFTA